MNNRFFATCFLIFCSITVGTAQPKLSLVGLIGYSAQYDINFGGSYYGYVESATQYGGGIEYAIRHGLAFGLTYTYMNTHIPIYDTYYRQQQNSGSDGTSISYLIADGVKYFPLHSVISPYIGAGAGMSFIKVDYDNSTYTRFAWDSKVGIKIQANRHLALFAQAMFQSIVQGFSESMYVGTGGASVGVSTYSSLYQFTFGGGLAISF